MLRSCFDPCFRLMLALRDPSRTGTEPSGADLLREARALLDAAADRALASFPADAVETARRLIEAWMDEAALAEPWPGREVWLAAPLQSRWKEGRKGGEWFFDVAGHLSPDKPHDAELAEVALRCLGFGFRGKLDNDVQTLRRLHRLLAARFGRDDGAPTFPPGLALDNGFASRAGLLLAGLAACALISFWAVEDTWLQTPAPSAYGEVRGPVRSGS